MNIHEEWRIRDVEQKAERAESRPHELDSLRRNVDSLEYSRREIRSCVDGLRSELESALNRICSLENEIVELKEDKEN